MKPILIAIGVSLITQLTLTIPVRAERPEVYDDSSIRRFSSFDIAGPTEKIEKRKDLRSDVVAWSYSSQDDFERLMGESERESYLRKAYFNGTSESKAYALLGLFILKSPIYDDLKKSFLSNSKDILINCRVRGLKDLESPPSIIQIIESGVLIPCIKAKTDGE